MRIDFIQDFSLTPPTLTLYPPECPFPVDSTYRHWVWHTSHDNTSLKTADLSCPAVINGSPSSASGTCSRPPFSFPCWDCS